jgi:hypothetical protein
VVERQSYTLLVGGSIPSLPTTVLVTQLRGLKLDKYGSFAVVIRRILLVFTIGGKLRGIRFCEAFKGLRTSRN